MQDRVTWRVSAEFQGSECKTCVDWHRWACQTLWNIATWYKSPIALERTQMMQQSLSSPSSIASTQVSSSTSEALQTETSLSWKHPTNTSVSYRTTLSTISFKGTKHSIAYTHTHSQRWHLKASPQQPLQQVVLKNTWSVRILFATVEWILVWRRTCRSCLILSLLFVVNHNASQSFGAAFNILPLSSANTHTRIYKCFFSSLC